MIISFENLSISGRKVKKGEAENKRVSIPVISVRYYLKCERDKWAKQAETNARAQPRSIRDSVHASSPIGIRVALSSVQGTRELEETDVRSAERILLSVSARLAVQTGAVRANPAMETKANRCHHAVQTHPLSARC